MDDHSDNALLRRARVDTTAFGAFYQRHARAVYAFFVRRTASVDVALDLTAETFARALQSLPRYDAGLGEPSAWLFGIARHVLSESVRRGVVDDRARRALSMQPLELDDEALRVLEANARRPALEALGELPADQRDAVFARHVEELEYAEIAERLRCSQGVVRQRVSRGLRALRTRLEAQGE